VVQKQASFLAVFDSPRIHPGRKPVVREILNDGQDMKGKFKQKKEKEKPDGPVCQDLRSRYFDC
jgi:hypothetical protein